MDQLPLNPIIRVHPFSGLVIDVDTWAAAHDYHRKHHQLHLLSLHGSGVMQGLGVVSTDPPSDSIIIDAGLAIDPHGNTIVVPERQYVSLGKAVGLAYLTLDYVESIPPAEGDDQDTRARVKEDFRIRVTQTLPEAGSIELARIELTGAGAGIVVAPNPWLPKPNEIDLRNRPQLHLTAPRTLTVGLVVLDDAQKLSPSHFTGVQYLLREIELSGLRPR